MEVGRTMDTTYQLVPFCILNSKMRENYYNDNRKYQFETDIISSSKDDNGNYLIKLNGTYFYPEGGGQPGDKGSINGFKVLDVQKIHGGIIHTINGKPEGTRAECKIDRDHRDHYMVQHSGQHLISAVLKHELDIDTISVHLGEIESKIEIDRSTISTDEIERLEDVINSYISTGKKVLYHETDDIGLSAFNIRRESKYTGYIRVVEIEGYDSVPCGGVHISNLYELGLIKITGFEKIRSHIRLVFLIGKNALLDYRKKSSIISEINSSLSTKTDEIISGLNILKKNVSELKIEKKDLSNTIVKSIVKDFHEKQQVSQIFENIPKSITQKVAVELSGNLLKPLLIINKSAKINWYLIDSEKKIINFKHIKDNLLPIINGKGGGRENLWQGSGELKDLDRFVNEFNNYVNTTLQIS